MLSSTCAHVFSPHKTRGKSGETNKHTIQLSRTDYKGASHKKQSLGNLSYESTGIASYQNDNCYHLFYFIQKPSKSAQIILKMHQISARKRKNKTWKILIVDGTSRITKTKRRLLELSNETPPALPLTVFAQLKILVLGSDFGILSVQKPELRSVWNLPCSKFFPPRNQGIYDYIL